MANPKWGTKRICQSCGAKFYDLQKSPILCPSCGTEFDPEALLKSRRPRSAPKPEAAKPKKPKPAPAEAASEDQEEDFAIDDEEASRLEVLAPVVRKPFDFVDFVEAVQGQLGSVDD